MNHPTWTHSGDALPPFDVVKAREALLQTHRNQCLELILGRPATPQEQHGVLPWPFLVTTLLEHAPHEPQRAALTENIRALVKKLMLLDITDVLPHDILAYLLLPGVNYLSVIKFIHEHLKPRTYLEIGVNTGDSLALCDPETQVIGVDPALDTRFSGERQPRFSLYNMTSDAFFHQVDPRAVFQGQPVDMAFIDGLHLFEFALRDFIHVERSCHRHSVVLLHDTHPLDPISTTRKDINQYHVGDTWKILPCLQKYRPDLKIATILTRPSGLTVITHLDPDNRVLSDHLEAIYQEFIYLDFTDCQKLQRSQAIHTLPIDPNRILNELLAEAQAAIRS